MYKPGDILTYRNIPYEYQEWTTYDGKLATGFNCNDETLLQHVNTINFGTITEERMHERIDDYLDNVERYKRLQELHDAGCAAYYAEKSKTPGSYTGD